MAINVKQLLASGLVELSRKRPLEKITIRELSDHTGVAKRTFYNHFQDKEDLIVWIYHRILDDPEDLITTRGYLEYLTRVYQAAQEQKAFFSQVAKMEGGVFFQEQEYNIMFRYYKKHAIEESDTGALSEHALYGIEYYARGTAAMFVQWLKLGAITPAERQALYAVHYMPSQVKKSFQVRGEE